MDPFGCWRPYGGRAPARVEMFASTVMNPPDLDVNCVANINTSIAVASVSICGQNVPVHIDAAPDPDLFVIVVRDLVVETMRPLIFTGDRAPVLLSFADVTIRGRIESDAASDSEARVISGCLGGRGGDGNPGAREGGGGAGHRFAGGNGGSQAGSANNFGRAVGRDLVAGPLFGGCLGGGAFDGSVRRPLGGAGGGALQVSASGTLSLPPSGAILLGGRAGGAGAVGFGGGGGAMLLEAGVLDVRGVVNVQGGGGGGSGGSDTAPGNIGTSGNGGGAGGAAPPCAGAGGNASAGAGGGGGDPTAPECGGGGAGGVGHFVSRTL